MQKVSDSGQFNSDILVLLPSYDSFCYGSLLTTQQEHVAKHLLCSILLFFYIYIYTFLYGKFSFGRGWESEWEWIIMEKFFFLFSQWGPSHSYLPSTSLKHFYNDIWNSHNISRKSLGFSTCYILFIFSAESSLIRHTFQLVTLISMKYCFAPKLNISNSIAQAMLSPENLWITRLILI